MTVILGVIGGVASGKSLVSKQFEELGAAVLDADRTGHQVLAEEKVQQALRARWGEKIFTADGKVDRKAVAKIVFAPPPEGAAELMFLEQVIHPKIGRHLRNRAAELVAQGDHKAMVLDAALLLEAGWDVICDKIVFVDAPLQARLQRALSRGWSEVNFTARENAQQTVENKRKCSDFIIDNSGTPQQTLAQVQEIWKNLG